MSLPQYDIRRLWEELCKRQDKRVQHLEGKFDEAYVMRQRCALCGSAASTASAGCLAWLPLQHSQVVQSGADPSCCGKRTCYLQGGRPGQ